jgi:hypothetical protein
MGTKNRLKKAVDLSINFIDDGAQIGRVLRKVQVVNLYNKQIAKLVPSNPSFVALV